MRQAPPIPDVFTPRMLAERWNCSERHIRNLIQSGELRSFRLGGKLLRVPRSAVEELDHEQHQRNEDREEVMRAEVVDAFSYPPRGMARDEAARYIGVGTTKFDEMVADKRMPNPKRIDGRVVWDRIALDAAFSDLPSEAGSRIDEILSRRSRR